MNTISRLCREAALDARGEKKAVSRKLKRELRKWRVASGEWRVASGEWRVASGEWRADDKKEKE
ncbi:hypothetical protein [Shewanella sediminis]|uniref:hypothetical protein n=1 Tax=Shewanella sediminis TaxID=271097 RepID=UPI00059CE0C8|nr:hypothetical protein [Shewanella sediminis]